MIRYVKRKNINIVKYNNCINNALQSRIYAFSWYLDIVADNWDVLVLNDYEAVMPIPWKKKYGFKYTSQPFFCQQLGVFSKTRTSENFQKKIISLIPKSIIKVSLTLNSNTFLSTKNLQPKKNYILVLNDFSEILFKSFSKGRKHAVKVALKNNLSQKKVTILELIKFKQEYYKDLNFPVDVLKKLSNYILNNDKGFIMGIYKDEKLLGGGLFLKTNDRIIYLFSSFTPDARKLQASSFLIYSVIKKFENSKITLDFEGGNLPNIGSFFKSFGAKNEEYYHINYINLP